MVIVKKRAVGDFLSRLEDNINNLESFGPKENKKVSFNGKVHQRFFKKNASATEYVGEEDDEEQMGAEVSEDQGSDTDDEGIEEGNGESVEDLDDVEEVDDVEDVDDVDDVDNIDNIDDEVKEDYDDGESTEESHDDKDDYEGEFDSLSPAEQLKLLMEPVSDQESDIDDENDYDSKDISNSDTDVLDDAQDTKNSLISDEELVDDQIIPKSKSLKLPLDAEDDSDEDETRTKKSNFERQQERLEKKISVLEKENLGEKPWMLRGEVSAKHRPVNSLLEHDLDFEHAARPSPVVTEEQTDEVEVLIKQRIKDQAWDDIERKSPSELGQKLKKKVVLDSEKAKKTLAEVYEEEAQEKFAPNHKNVQSVDPETQKVHDEISGLFSKVCRKLDSLSGFKFAPRAHSLSNHIGSSHIWKNSSVK